MSFKIGPDPVSQQEEHFEAAPAFRPLSVYDAWDSTGQSRWHAEMLSLGSKLVAEKPGPSRPPAEPTRVRSFWTRVRLAYAVLRGKAYARPLRQPRQLRQSSRA